MYGDYETDSFAVAKERCYGNQLILTHFCRRLNRPHSLAFRKGMQLRLIMRELIAALMPLHRVKKLCEHRPSGFGVKVGQKFLLGGSQWGPDL